MFYVNRSCLRHMAKFHLNFILKKSYCTDMYENDIFLASVSVGLGTQSHAGLFRGLLPTFILIPYSSNETHISFDSV